MRIIMSIFFLAVYCSCKLRTQRPPQEVVVNAPISVANTIKSGEWLLLLKLRKNDGLWYKYDTTANDIGLKKIDPITIANIKTALDEIEKIYSIQLDTSKNILFKNEADFPNEDFKKIKEALIQKNIFKFRIATTSEN